MTHEIKFPAPALQIDFAGKLKEIRTKYLQDALLETMGKLKIVEVDKKLAEYVPEGDLSLLAQNGLRAELLFPVPIILESNPFLIGYYRLLMGYSQKEFYGADKGFGAGCFKSMEDRGVINKKAENLIGALCMAFCDSASALLRGLEKLELTKKLFDDLTLLTVGLQLRGGANNKVGKIGTEQVFNVIKKIVRHAVEDMTDNSIKINSPTGRKFYIQFAADPDIVIQEEMAVNHLRNVAAIEIKGGTDISNIHNRLGEAEKSHQKARKQGYTEFWTVVNVSQFDYKKAQNESPTTNRFYSLSSLLLCEDEEYEDFRRRIISLTAISDF